MGGYDVFYSLFDEKAAHWSSPQNAGRPINSGKDDTGFRISSSEKMAVLSSNRPGGYGGFDLYQVCLVPEGNKYPQEPAIAGYEVGTAEEGMSAVDPGPDAEAENHERLVHPGLFGRHLILIG